MSNSNASSQNPPHYHWSSSVKKAMNASHQMDHFEIIDEGIRKLLPGLNPNKAASPNKLKPRVLKELGDILAPIVTLIYNA